jgi:hypothetical protein
MNLQIPELSKFKEYLCSICDAELLDEERVIKLNCDHMFHSECIKNWLKKKNNCPNCRRIAYEIKWFPLSTYYYLVSIKLKLTDNYYFQFSLLSIEKISKYKKKTSSIILQILVYRFYNMHHASSKLIFSSLRTGTCYLTA